MATAAKTGSRVEILDTTLRDGAQAEGISFSINDKFAILDSLISIGVGFVEAGNPGSNPKDREFFMQYASRAPQMGDTVLCAFGSTKRKDVAAAEDANLQAILEAGTSVVVVFGKVWDTEVREILRTTPDENLAIISDTVRYLRAAGRRVIFDAEHYFEAWRDNPDYTDECLAAAACAGAESLVLCDTNGSAMPDEVAGCVRDTVRRFPDVRVGIHCHNDCGLAVANSVLAVQAGATHVQGTFNGIGERCGNASLSAIIGNLQGKLGYRCIPEDRLELLTSVARRMADIANLTLPAGEPFVGTSAFSHKAGMHVDAIKKRPSTYEHIDPTAIGNDRRFLLSEISGRSAVLDVIRRIRPDIDKSSPVVPRILERMKDMELRGYQFEGAQASQDLLVCKELGLYEPFFRLEKMRISSEQPQVGRFSAYSYIKILVDGVDEVTAAEGAGPVNAMDRALKKAMEVFYPELADLRLTDYKVRVLNAEATASCVRVLIETTDGSDIWTTVGVSTDILEASWLALVDSIEYKLMIRKIRGPGH
ncbi:MAG: citramalate synthase [Clostridia bacterium]|nr:citramalate synthase [Clostridia bacterium]